MGETSTWGFEEGDEIVPGRYAIAWLGGGTRYEVYTALDERMLTVVVLKLLRPERREDERAVREMEREAEIVLGLGHPGIVRAFEATLDGPKPHIVLEHVEGPTLGRLLRRQGHLAAEQVLPLALQVASALHYLQGLELVHLDIKPDNVIMGAPPRLIDFSIARTTKEAESIEIPLGTFAYMAPEQCEPGKHGEIGTAADVWGLGMTLYEAVTAEHAFAGTSEDPEERFPQLREAPAWIPEWVPSGMKEIILQCLSPNASARPSAAEVALHLEPLVAGLPTYPSFKLRRPGLD